MGERGVLRNPTRWLVAGIYLVAGVLALNAAVRATSLTKVILLVVAVVGCGVLSGRASRSAIWIGDAGVIARADRFTRHLRWDDIERFELGTRPENWYSSAVQVLQKAADHHGQRRG